MRFCCYAVGIGNAYFLQYKLIPQVLFFVELTNTLCVFRDKHKMIFLSQHSDVGCLQSCTWVFSKSMPFTFKTLTVLPKNIAYTYT